MKPLLLLSIQFAGCLQLFVAVANFFLPKKLGYQENLAKVSPIVRQIFYVHSLYIVLVLIAFGVICLRFPEELLGGSGGIGRFLCGFMAVFWNLRAVLQFVYYDRDVKKAYPIQGLLFSLIFASLGAIFLAATLYVYAHL